MPQKRKFHFLTIACAIQCDSATQLGIPEFPGEAFKTNGTGVYDRTSEPSEEPSELTAKLFNFMIPQDPLKIHYGEKDIRTACIKMLDFKYPELKKIALPPISFASNPDEKMIRRQKWAEEYSKEHELNGKEVWIEVDTLENEINNNPEFIKKLSAFENSTDMTKLIDSHQNKWAPISSNTIGGHTFGLN